MHNAGINIAIGPFNSRGFMLHHDWTDQKGRTL